MHLVEQCPEENDANHKSKLHHRINAIKQSGGYLSLKGRNQIQ